MRAETLTDQQLLDRIRKDDRKAFAVLYERYWDKLFTVTMHRLDDEHEAEEIVQEIFLDIWKRRSDLQIRHTLNTYLSVAVKYRVINHLSRQHQRKQGLAALAQGQPESENNIYNQINKKELQAQLEQCINRLPEKCRIVFLLNREEQKTYAEIAADLNISQKTVEAHMSKALNVLRQSLKVSVPILFALLKK